MKLPINFSKDKFTNSSHPNRDQKGQALVIILLVMSAVLVVSMSIASRSVTDISTVTYEEESLRAFSAAEAGVEELLNQEAPYTAIPATDLGNNTFFSADPTLVQQSREYVYPAPLGNGDVAVFWFAEKDPTTLEFTCAGGNCFRGTIFHRICWGTNPTPQQSAIELSIYYDSIPGTATGTPPDLSKVSVARMGYVSSGSAGTWVPRGFEDADNPQKTIGGKTFQNCTRVIQLGSPPPAGLGIPCPNTQGCILAVAAKMIGISAGFLPDEIGIYPQITGGPNTRLPAQGVTINSEGWTGDTRRRLNVTKTFPVPPGLFESAIYSSNSIIKN